MPSVFSQTPNAIWSWPLAMDALVAAPAHHTLLLENEKMRVVETRIPPGQTVPVHTHGASPVCYSS
jgi:quercetin dioxygenase-like cupin family protein